MTGRRLRTRLYADLTRKEREEADRIRYSLWNRTLSDGKLTELQEMFSRGIYDDERMALVQIEAEIAYRQRL